ncbi:MAG TPA: GAF domain-containing sensor histidine kinase [Anaerolineae bacterium]
MIRSRRLNTRILRWLAIIGPVLFWSGVLILRTILFGEQRAFEADLFALVMIALGAAVFATWVFGIVEQRERETLLRSKQLQGLHQAALELTTEHQLAPVLQKVVDLARDLVGARYAALGVLDTRGESIEQFITAGITPEERAQMGEPPRGHGLLGALITEGKAIRIPEISLDERSVGFPPRHPPMHSLLGVPIRSKGKLIGDLYLTDKIITTNGGERESVFSDTDQEIVEMFATQAAIAIENAQLYRQTGELAVLQERERFGMDLHDGIIQSIYGIGLILEDGEQWVEQEPRMARERMGSAINALNDVIRDIRNYILNLRPQRFQGRDLKRGLDELARDLRANTFLNIEVETDTVDTNALKPEDTVEILHVVQEALTNIRKHARAMTVNIALARADKELLLTIEDDGVGLNAMGTRKGEGHGLGNMRERARALGGLVEIEPRAPNGTRITLRIPAP